MIRYQCHHCGEMLTVGDAKAGKAHVCSLCGKSSLVPGGEPAPAPSAAAQPSAVLTPAAAQPAPRKVSGGAKGIDAALFCIGVCVAGYFFLVFDTSVDTPLGPVNNLGLMQDRQNGIIIGCALFIAGIVLHAVAGARAHGTE